MWKNRMMRQTIKNALREVYWAYHGKKLNLPPLPASPKSILYVCKGNICRSPFAERVTKKLLEKGSNDILTIQSAGIKATVENPPPKEAIVAAKAFGISMDEHRAQYLTKELFCGSDMIIVMEVEHLHQLEEAYPESKGRCFLLSMFSNDQHGWGNYYSQYNIADPYGKNNEQFIICYERIKMCINNLLLKIG
jgi:protein-tyrosine phosphatase